MGPGDTICAVSAHIGMGLTASLKMVLLSPMKELRAIPTAPQGHVIEARLDKDGGLIATVLVQNGTRVPAIAIVAGLSVGRGRAMNREKRNKLQRPGLGSVEIMD